MILRIDFRGLKNLISRLGQILSRLRDWPSGTQGDIGASLRTLIRTQMDSEGRSSGSPWAPLSLRYSGWKSRRYSSRKILQRGGSLYTTFTRKGGIQAITFGQGGSVNGIEFKIGGPDVSYWRFHQYGAPNANLPQRQIIPQPLPDGFISGVRDIVGRYIIKG